MITTKWLFLDSTRMEHSQGVEWVLHPPEKVSSAPLFFSRQVLDSAVSVLFDEDARLFKMWFMELSAAQEMVLTYWTSTDGRNWDRPELRLFDESQPVNTVMKGTGNSGPGTYGVFSLHRVIIDQTAEDPDKKYKMLYWDKPRQSSSGALAAFSPDGIHWTKPQEEVALFGGHDAINFVQDPETGQYDCHQVLTVQRESNSVSAKDNLPGLKRLVHVRTSEDFLTWSEARLLFDTDEDDPEDMQHYFFQVERYAGMYLGYLTAYFTDAQRGDTRLYYSADGLTWNKTHGRESFIPNGAAGEWDHSWTSPVQGSIPVNGQLYFYYVGINRPHNWLAWRIEEKSAGDGLTRYARELAKVDNLAIKGQARAHALVEELTELIHSRQKEEDESFIRGVGLAVLREDGFVSVRSGEPEGKFVTQATRLTGRVSINCDCRNGWIAIGLLDEAGREIEGYESNRCVIKGQDSSNCELRWNESDSLPAGDRAVKFQIRMSQCDLYSISF